jgi:putative SOS response-associated peptidase YedK
MCGRFTQMYTWEQLSFLYNLSNPAFPNIRPKWNVAPTQDVGVVVAEESGRIYKTMRWGLVPMWAKDLKIGNQAINTRLDSAATKPMFRSAWKSRRCLIPASGYYEWREIAVPDQKKPAKLPFYVSMKDGVQMTFAGLWERWGPDDDKVLSSPSLRRTPPRASRAPHAYARHPPERWLRALAIRRRSSRRSRNRRRGRDPAGLAENEQAVL